MIQRLCFILLSAVVVVCVCDPAKVGGEQNWPQWRGPQANGVAAGGGYATSWSTSKNITWKYELPGLGASTPIIWQNQILVTTEDGGMNAVLCVDRAGQKQWSTKLGQERRLHRNRKASGCNPSPITDGKHVFAYFKSGDLACLDMKGSIVWQMNLQEKYGEDTLWWDLGTSPVLTKDLVVVACMQTGDSYLLGVEKESGKVAFKEDRNVEAPGESAQSYTTPLVVDQEDAQIMVVLGADHVTAHDAKTGKQIWICGGLNPGQRGNWRSISSPVVAEGLVVAPYARGGSLTAIKLGGKGNVTKSHVAWSNNGPAADVPSPATANGKLYTCTDRGVVAVFDLKTGELIKETEGLPSRDSFSSSVALAGEHLYVTSESAVTYVYKADGLELVAQNDLEDFAIATPIFCDGKIYMRTDKYLWCIGQ